MRTTVRYGVVSYRVLLYNLCTIDSTVLLYLPPYCCIQKTKNKDREEYGAANFGKHAPQPWGKVKKESSVLKRHSICDPPLGLSGVRETMDRRRIKESVLEGRN